MSAMQTRSVRVDAGALRIAERTLARSGATFSGLVRDVVDYVARTGKMPRLEGEGAQAPDERMLAFERRADELTLGARSDPAYAAAPAEELLSAALEERYG